MVRLICIFAAATLAILTSGCWDRIEIQDRALVKAIAIDAVPSSLYPADKAATFFQPHGEKKYRFSFQVIKLSPMEKKGAKTGSDTYVISNTGQSLFEVMRDTLGQTSKVLNSEYMDTVIISEAVLKDTHLKPLLDLLFREPEFRWRIKIFITSGEADKLLRFDTPTSEPGGEFIAKVANNQIRNSHIPSGKTDLGYVIMTLDNDGDLFLPRVELADNVFKMGGGAVFKGDRFAGYVDDYTVQGARLWRGLQKSAAIVAECPQHPGKTITLKMIREKSVVKPYWEGGSLYFTVDVKLTGNLEEDECAEKPVDQKQIPELEALFQDEVANCISRSIQVFQSYPCDPDGYFAGKVKAYLPNVWADIEKNWPAVFANTPFYVNVHVTIHSLGEHR